MTKLHYDDLTKAYTNEIMTKIAVNSPRRLFTSISFDQRLLKSSDPKHKTYVHKVFQNLVSRSNYQPYMTTTTFKHIPLSVTAMKQQYRFFSQSTWSKYSHAYSHLLSNMTNHFNKKQHLHPMTFDFFDVPGTRDSRFAPFTENTIPHIHSIFLVHRKTVPAFQYHIETDFHLITKHHSLCESIQTIHSEPINEDLHKVVSYCSKFYKNVYAQKYKMTEDYDLFNQFPITEEQKKILASNRQELRYQAITNKIFEDSYAQEIDFTKMKEMRRELRKRFNMS